VDDDRLTIACDANIKFCPVERGAEQRRKRLVAVLLWSIDRGAVQASMGEDEWPVGHVHGRCGSPGGMSLAAHLTFTAFHALATVFASVLFAP
jgi:hypothetical protein